MFCLLSSLLFSRRWRGRESFYCSQGAVRAVIFRSPLVSPAPDPLNMPISSSGLITMTALDPHSMLCHKPKGSSTLSSLQGTVWSNLVLIKSYLTPYTKETGKEGGGMWWWWGASLMSLQTMVHLGYVTHTHTHAHLWVQMTTHTHTLYCRSESGLSGSDWTKAAFPSICQELYPCWEAFNLKSV